MHGNAEQLARGAEKASYTQSTVTSTLGYDIQLGATFIELHEKYGISDGEYGDILDAYKRGDDQLLAGYRPLTEIQGPGPIVTPIVLPEATKSEWVYRGSPRLDHILVKKVSKEHSSQLIVPDAYRDNTDIGTVVSVGPLVKDLHKSQLVMFDKYATVGQSVRLIDEDGDEVELLLLKSINVQLTLERLHREG